MANGFRVPGMSAKAAAAVRERLQQRLVALIDLELTLKHVHWNVVGPNFIGVHQMLDPQVAAVRAMVDAVAERIATLGGSPVGTPGFVASNRTWQDYSLGRGSTLEHLGALDLVYDGVVEDHRAAIAEFDELDLVTQDLLIEQSAELEQFQWFVRAHLEDRGGELATTGATSLQDAADRASSRRDDSARGTKRAARTTKRSARKR